MMLLSAFHPSRRTLTDFALRQAANNTSHKRLQAHLAQCARCRALIATDRTLIASLATPPVAGLRDDALSRILTARADGRRIILPDGTARAPAPAATRWLAAAVIVAVVVTGVVVQSLASPAVASEPSGHVTFSPAQPTAGATVSVVYRPMLSIARNDELVLRARFRTQWNGAYLWDTHQQVVARLKRDGSGNFNGSFVLPANAVYAAVAVEDRDANRVDANAGRLWELLVHESGKPTYAALHQQFNDLLGRSPDSALSVVQLSTQLHPDDPRTWASRISFERFMLGAAHAESIAQASRDRVVSFDRAFRALPADAVTHEMMQGVTSNTIQLDGTRFPELRAIGRYWRDRLLADTRPSAVLTYQRVSVMNSRALEDSTTARASLDSVENFWLSGDSLNWRAAQFGMQIAQRAHDSAAVLRWIDRLSRFTPSLVPGFLTASTSRDPRLRTAAIERTKAYLRTLETSDNARRPLEASAEEDRRLRERETRQVLAGLSGLLLDAGDTTASVAALRKATADGWDLPLFTRLADLSLRAGDSLTAGRALAFIAVDPASPRVQADSSTRRLARLVRDTPAALATARGELTRRVVASSMTRSIPSAASARLTTSSGGTATLSEIARGRPAIIVFWSRFCGPSRAQLTLYKQLRADLDARNIAFVPIAVEAPSNDLLASLTEMKVTLDSYYDVHGEARRAFDNMATPTFYVLDAGGRLRFTGNFPDLALTQAVALGR